VVNPNQEEIALNVTFHASGIVVREQMGLVSGRNRELIFQKPQNFKQFSGLSGVVANPFLILFVLG
jgi:hypothetical protein